MNVRDIELEDRETNTSDQDAVFGERDSINREKGHGVHTPRNVEEQINATLSDDGRGHKLRDPLKAAANQRS
ncbi:MAG: hypothetical protein H7123_04290 [Thermoleophilia bacterium]|nr:hypothetical protein [Thermoleophilia bacterium]